MALLQLKVAVAVLVLGLGIGGGGLLSEVMESNQEGFSFSQQPYRPPPRPPEVLPPVMLHYAPRPPVEPAPAQGLGGIRLFRIFGITVFLHWSWFIVALFQIHRGRGNYHSLMWSAAEYLTLFATVLAHEFGHALACRSVGGRADHITLWPLGGIAYVDPPQRPGAVLWSIAAGPLVNVVLLPITWILAYHFGHGYGDVSSYFRILFFINTGLLVFNILPIYPLDGGQILQSILWFFMGRARSLMVAAWVGLVGAVLLMLLALYIGSIFTVAIAAFVGLMAWSGIKRAQMMRAYGVN